MKEYIDRNTVCEKCNNKKYCFIEMSNGEEKFKCPVYKVSPADVVEVIHGKWINSHGNIVCSVCEAEYSDEIRFMNRNYKGELLPYCPNCGARMNKEK